MIDENGCYFSWYCVFNKHEKKIFVLGTAGQAQIRGIFDFGF
jgi:hypothetical protein